MKNKYHDHIRHVLLMMMIVSVCCMMHVILTMYLYVVPVWVLTPCSSSSHLNTSFLNHSRVIPSGSRTLMMFYTRLFFQLYSQRSYQD